MGFSWQEINPAEGSVKSRVLRPQHIVATALRTGRPKDRIRIIQFVEENAVDLAALCDVIGRHGLEQAWQAFCDLISLGSPVARQEWRVAESSQPGPRSNRHDDGRTNYS
jgi:hypothetical protein